jgi:hypothetical protein
MSFNSETDISEQTIRIINDTVNNSIISFRSFILFAQMQSGKTNAFLLFSGEMIRQEKIENVIIFTGNRDNELKNQLIDEIRGSNKKQSFFDLKYTKYLMDYLNLFSGYRFSKFDAPDEARIQRGQAGVDFILNHIKNQFCSNVIPIYDNVINAIKKMVCGKKLKILIYFTL